MGGSGERETMPKRERPSIREDGDRGAWRKKRGVQKVDKNWEESDHLPEGPEANEPEWWEYGEALDEEWKKGEK